MIEPQDLFSHLIQKIEAQTFEIEDLHKAINKIEESTRGERVKKTLTIYSLIWI